MKRYILISLALVSMAVSAQSKFGYVSYGEILKALPEYSMVNAQLDELQVKYEAEVIRSDREFNQKYAEFIEEQTQFPDNIRMKRHKELMELMEKSMAFKDEINSTMREARREMLKPLRDKIDEVLLQICVDEGFDYILNTDDHAYVAINPKRGKDVTDKVKKALNIEQ